MTFEERREQAKRAIEIKTPWILIANGIVELTKAFVSATSMIVSFCETMDKIQSLIPPERTLWQRIKAKFKWLFK